MQNSYSTIAILSAIVMVATTATVLNNTLPSQQAYASACNVFDNSQTGVITTNPNHNGGCSSDQSLDAANALQGHSHVNHTFK